MSQSKTALEVKFRTIYAWLIAGVLGFFLGISMLMIVTNGIRNGTLLLVGLNGLFVATFGYVQLRARTRSAHRFDAEGVTCRGSKRFPWSDLVSVDYVMALEPGGGEEKLWRIELKFRGGEAWLLPRRIKNLREISEFVADLPVLHQKRIGTRRSSPLQNSTPNTM